MEEQARARRISRDRAYGRQCHLRHASLLVSKQRALYPFHIAALIKRNAYGQELSCKYFVTGIGVRDDPMNQRKAE